MSARGRARVGILLSGRGSNFLSLHQAVEAGQIPAEIALVASNKPAALGLERARGLGLETFALSHRGLSREEHEGKLIAALEAARVDWVCLAGYMRLLSPRLVRAYAGRMLNIHPSLLPAFPGLRAQQQAWEHGVRVAGCTVHLVDEGLDSGPIVVQRSVDVEDSESAEGLAAKILRQEHLAYPDALRRLLTEPWKIEGRRVVFQAQAEAEQGGSQKLP